MEHIAYETLCAVLSYLDAADLARCAAVCSQWSQAASENLVWRCVYVRRWQVSEDQALAYTPGSWRDAYRTVQLGLPAVPLQVVSGAHTDEVWLVRWSHAGDRLLSASKDGLLRTWAWARAPDLHALAPGPGAAPPLAADRVLALGAPVTDADWSASDELIVATTMANKVYVLRSATGEQIYETAVNEYDCYAKWLPDESLLLGHSSSVTMVGPLRGQGEGQEEAEQEEEEEWEEGLWRVRHTFRRVYIGPGPGVSPAEPLVLSADYMTGRDLAHIPVVSPDGAYFVFMRAHDSPEQNLLGRARVLGPGDEGEGEGEGGQIWPTYLRTDGTVLGVCLLRDHTLLLNCRLFAAGPPLRQPSDRFELQLIDAAAGRVLRRFPGRMGSSQLFLTWPDASLADPHQALISSGSYDGAVWVYHRLHGTLLARLHRHTALVNSVAFHPRVPGLLASASDDGTFILWAPRARGPARPLT